tara:strand:- start:1042 stop:1224 length:183 start_codon:yes stop_codon:yes gene_type:complete
MKLPANFFENLTQEQFDYVLNVLIMYKQINPNKEVYMNEKTFKNAISVVNNFIASQNSKN